ncbi:retrovirus-related Pol polyprotein from transposon TNT 1-94 [Gossypium australe]|uniref:Retrovirus-related Pol polyprotein from transposon TNT 1-94 n=1 Tax=Gossypium australe TaxID=47621 RepID=A0A5B6WEK0_9ROSI|nr:retrovirus-related Pol polyprotein from transposon TNT 1-94 [Gossypium australe]
MLKSKPLKGMILESCLIFIMGTKPLETDKCNARLVAKRYKQEYGVDYTKVFALVARHDSIRLVIALAA